MKSRNVFFLILCICIVLFPREAYAQFAVNDSTNNENAQTRTISTGPANEYSEGGNGEVAYIPFNAYYVKGYVNVYGVAPSGYCGGAIYRNATRLHPTNTTYKEYDVYPKSQGRGLERLVKGGNGSWYYTPNHYKSFVIMD